MPWPWSKQQPQLPLEAKALDGWGKEAKDEGQVSPTQPWQPRLPHPPNMVNYQKWSNDAEASIAFNVLTDIIAGVGFFTQMPEDEEGKEDKEEAKEHPNKALIDDYCTRVNLDEDLAQITLTMLTKGFCPVERLGDYDLKILPPETFYIYRDKFGTVLKYTQEYTPNSPITTWAGSEMEKIIIFKHRETTSHPYGKSLLEPIGSLLDTRNQMNVDIGKVLHRLAYPIPIMQTSRDKTNLESAITDREPDQWVLIGNVQEGEVRWDILETSGRNQPQTWIELINLQIAEGLHAPLLLYLKNATEASATVMMESVDRLVNGIQRYLKRRVEDLLFEPQCGEPVPQLNWGQPKTGLEEVTMTELASLLNSPAVAPNQKQELLTQFFPNLSEPDWTAQGGPMLMPFGQQPFQKDKPFQKQQPPGVEVPIEVLTEQLNDLDMGLKIIETNYRERRLPFVDAVKQGGRTIDAYLKRIHGESESFSKAREVKFREWVARIMPSGEKPTYHVTVS